MLSLVALIPIALAGACAQDDASPECAEDPVWAGDVEIGDEMDLESLVGCTTIKGNLSIETTALTDVDALYQLESVQGDLTIEGNEYLESVDGLARLDNVWGTITLGENTLLRGLDQLESLWLVGDVVIVSNMSLTTLAATDATVVGNVLIGGNYALTDVRIGPVEAVAGDLHITSNSSLERLDLDELTAVEGAVIITSNPRLPTCEAERLLQQLVDAGFDGESLIEGNLDAASCAL